MVLSVYRPIFLLHFPFKFIHKNVVKWSVDNEYLLQWMKLNNNSFFQTPFITWPISENSNENQLIKLIFNHSKEKKTSSTEFPFWPTWNTITNVVLINVRVSLTFSPSEEKLDWTGNSSRVVLIQQNFVSDFLSLVFFSFFCEDSKCATLLHLTCLLNYYFDVWPRGALVSRLPA